MRKNGYVAYNTAYKGLNTAQKEAVDTIEGPVMVVAGPGTGKTHILTLRIANILKSTDTPPDGVLALTFTEAGVDAMKQRLLKLMGPTAYKVGIYTFHGFCNDTIHSHPEYFSRIISSNPLTDIESILYIREGLDVLTLDKLKPFGDPYFYVQSIRGAISTLKREHKTPREVIEHSKSRITAIEKDPESFHQKGVHKGKMKGLPQTQLTKLQKEYELGLIFEWYEKTLTEKKKFDFEDMIGEVVRELRSNSEFLLVIQEKYLYILADEHQDANGAQNTLLELLSAYHNNPNLFIVGDEKQAIFQFQGATLDSFAYFQKLFPKARLIALTESYRSGTVLLDAAHSLMKESIPAHRHPKLISRVEQSHLAVLEERIFTSEEMEIAWVVSDIANKIGEGFSAGDMAVVFRTNADAIRISRALSQRGIVHTLDSKSNIFKNHIIAQLVIFLRLCTHIGNDEYVSHVLHFPWSNITSHDVYKIILYGQKRRIPYIEVILSKEYLRASGVHNVEMIYAHALILQELAKVAREESARDFLDHVLQKSGLLMYVLKRHDAVAVLGAIRGLVATLEKLSSTKTLYTGLDFVHDIQLYEEYGIEIEPDTQPKERSHAVHLVTAHRSKGLEYDYVYIVHARDGHWGNRIKRNNLSLSILALEPETDVDDERRLMYVALTRAKVFVSVSYGIVSQSRIKEAGLTQYMSEIDPTLIAHCDTEEFESSVAPQDLFALAPTHTQSIHDLQFLQDAFIEQGISATALNNYLECPWKYFYRNLVRIPEKPSPSSLYGNALHNALRLFRDISSSTQEYQTLDTLLGYLKDSIDTQGFTPITYKDAYQKGIRALTDWYNRNKDDYQFNTMCERKFEVYMPTASNTPAQVLLRGMIDVLEFRIDGSVHVIDYKTGKHKSRAEIEGEGKNATGDYKRQLDFYCILLELSDIQAPSTLRIEFIEPDKKNKTVIHNFNYDAAAVAELKSTIVRVASEIYSLAFWDKTCTDATCEYCALHALTLEPLPAANL